MNLTKRICKKAQKGDKHATHELLESSYQEIFSYLSRLCRNVQDAEDLTQETFVKVWSSLSDYRGQCKFLTWVYRIAHNNYIDWYRKKTSKHCKKLLWKEYVEQKTNSSRNVFDREISEYLYKLVDQFDEGKKQAVHLHYYQGLSLKETAIVLDIATSTVKYRLRKVIGILRNKICVENKKTNNLKLLKAVKL